MSITTWPVASRNRVVHAFRPGADSTAEAPFRTLRQHAWATPGVRVALRDDRRLAGQITLFSSLNVDAARLARHGDLEAAGKAALAAADVESAAEFHQLSEILSNLPPHDAERVIDGILPESAPTTLAETLRAIARRTAAAHLHIFVDAALTEVLAGKIAEVHDGYVILAVATGAATMVPRWLATAAHRDHIGELLILVTDKLDEASAVVEAMPAIETGDCASFSPFGRGDNARILHVSPADQQLLAGTPVPLRVLVPVHLDE